MTFNCSKCQSEIKSENINITTDIAKCQNCGNISKASNLTKVDRPFSKTPPLGSKIEVIKGYGDEIEFILPKKGFTARSIPTLFFGLIWLSFLTFWTIMASKASIIFDAFSIPFWLAGFSLIYGVLKSVTTSQSLKIDRINLSLIKKSIFGNKIFKYSLNEILAINMSKPLSKNPLMAFSNIGNQKRPGEVMNYPNLVTTEKSILFFESATLIEQQWLVNYLTKELKLVD